MSETKTAHTAPAANSAKMLKAMVGIGVFCALMIVLTFEGTKPIIAQKRAEALQKAIFQVLPGITQTKTFELNENKQFVEADGKDKEAQVVYAGYDENDNLVGIALEASGQGYADIIRILYGYDPETQTVTGFHVLETKETPGLGDKIEKDPAFLANFEALDVSLNDDKSAIRNKVVPVKSGEKKNPWEVDAITGATISSRAIGNALGESTAFWMPLIYNNREVFEMQNGDNEKLSQ